MDNKYTDYVKEHLQTGAEYSQNLITTAQTVGHEVAQKITDVMANNLTLGKSFLNCKSFEDIVNWGEQMVQANLEHFVETGGSIYSKTCNEVTKANAAVAKKVAQCAANIKNKFEDTKI